MTTGNNSLFKRRSLDFHICSFLKPINARNAQNIIEKNYDLDLGINSFMPLDIMFGFEKSK